MMYLRSIALFFAFAVTAQATHCPDAWYQNGDMCYVQVKQGATFQAAQDSCKLLGGDLASIPTAEDNEFLRTTLNLQPGVYWIGLTSEDWRETPLHWNDGHEVTYTNWLSGEPSSPGVEKCTQYRTPAGNWNDVGCENRYFYICSKHPDDQPKVDCPSGWIAFEDHCYLEVKEGASFAAAQAGCETRGGNLAGIPSAGSNEFVRTILNLQPGIYWIGLTSEDWRETPLYWNDGHKVTYTNWLTGEPNSPGVEKCTQYRTPAGNWNDVGCGNQYYFICSKHPENECEEDIAELENVNSSLEDEIVQLNSKNEELESENAAVTEEIVELERKNSNLMEQDLHQKKQIEELESKLKDCEENAGNKNPSGWYKANNGFQYILTKKKQMWAKNRDLCKKMGGRLASTGMRDLELRREILKELSSPKKAWIGLVDPDGDFSFMWMDDVSGTDANIHWNPKPQQPDGGGKDRCGKVTKKKKYLTDDLFCGKKLVAVCEKSL